MKNVLTVLIVVVAFGLMVIMGYLIDKSLNVSNEFDEIIDETIDKIIIEPGQIWLSETDNPFEKDIYWYIIEIKEGYVKFFSIKYNKEKEHWDIPKENLWISSEINLFTRLYKRIK